MSENTPATPIVVPPTATNDQLMTAFRDVLKIIGSALAMRGFFEASYVEGFAGALVVLAPFIWSQLKTRSNHAKLWILAQVAPNNVGQAVVKK